MERRFRIVDSEIIQALPKKMSLFHRNAQGGYPARATIEALYGVVKRIVFEVELIVSPDYAIPKSFRAHPAKCPEPWPSSGRRFKGNEAVPIDRFYPSALPLVGLRPNLALNLFWYSSLFAFSKFCGLIVLYVTKWIEHRAAGDIINFAFSMRRGGAMSKAGLILKAIVSDMMQQMIRT